MRPVKSTVLRGGAAPFISQRQSLEEQLDCRAQSCRLRGHMAERDAPRPPSSRSRDVAGEDFLFHLYRGSELLQDNRVHDAKAELEQALSLQPSDPKGQDLLGIVYFRLGLYPRAISIYEQLIRTHPEAIEPRINLALSYLKTGQPAQARAELEKVVDQSPGHSRAWGYLGLAFQRLGDVERASYAFAAGGHDGMARRLVEMAIPGGGASLLPESLSPGEGRRDSNPDVDSLRPTIPFTEAAAEISGLLRPSDLMGTFRPSDGFPPPSGSPLRPSQAPASPPTGALFPSLAPYSLSPSSIDIEGPLSLHPKTSAPRRLVDLGRDLLFVFPRDVPIALHSSGVVLVRTGTGFVTRLEAVMAMAHSGGHTSTVQKRRARGRQIDEPLGGPRAPLIEIAGKGELVLGPTAGQRLHPIALDEETFYLREDALVGFELGVSYENGRLPLGDGDAVPMVQLRGPGSVIAAIPDSAAALEIAEGRSTSIRAVTVLGWLGRVVPRALLASEAPGGMRGLVSFSGEGMVLVNGR